MKDRNEIAEALAASGYIADAELATAISLMQLLRRPLLLEGEAGVGKTEVAKALAGVHATELIRLQCYEGLDQSSALYEWNYQRQLLAIQAHRGAADSIEDQIFSEKYLLERPLLAAIRREKPPVLLIDEIDRADDEFEAFLLELLSDFQVSIPELGTIKAIIDPACGADLERHARAVRRAAPPLPLSLCRLSRCRARGAHHHGARSTARPPRCRCRSRGWSRASARRSCARCRASPRRWIGRRRWSASTCATFTTRPRRCMRR